MPRLVPERIRRQRLGAPRHARARAPFRRLVSLADQIGSDREFFPFEPGPDPGYIHQARARARRAVREKGFQRADRPSRAPPADFARLFGYAQPRPLQHAAAAAPLDRPLLILEAETGSGKTEAAILRFAALWRAGLVDGLYFALPTRAAAKQIHARVDRALRSLFPDEPWAETVRAIPGYPMAGAAQGWPKEDFKVYWEDKPDEETRHARWAAEASRNSSRQRPRSAPSTRRCSPGSRSNGRTCVALRSPEAFSLSTRRTRATRT